jgi:hypothetical protein
MSVQAGRFGALVDFSEVCCAKLFDRTPYSATKYRPNVGGPEIVD